MKKRAHIYYSGEVQGVGFRWTVERLASRGGVTGWVMNLDDGRVECLFEGDEKDILDIIEMVRKKFAAYIRDADIEWSDAKDEFGGFDIRFE